MFIIQLLEKNKDGTSSYANQLASGAFTTEESAKKEVVRRLTDSGYALSYEKAEAGQMFFYVKELQVVE